MALSFFEESCHPAQTRFLARLGMTEKEGKASSQTKNAAWAQASLYFISFAEQKNEKRGMPANDFPEDFSPRSDFLPAKAYVDTPSREKSLPG
jgi:hypothetical protein